METKKKFAVILAGCGNRDGAEIHESVMTLYAIAKSGSSYQVFAPDIEQHHVINHYTGETTRESRNILVEAARIARGKISPLSDFDAQKYDILMFAGGFGVAKNFCNYAFEGSECKINPDIEKAVRAMHTAGKPIGALCISPVILAKVLDQVTITMGQDQEAIRNVKAMGAIHQPTRAGEIVIDQKNKVVTSPCYMLDSTIVDVATEAMKVVDALISL